MIVTSARVYIQVSFEIFVVIKVVKMQPYTPISPSPFTGLCTMCSLIMFVFGGFLVIPGIIIATYNAQNLFVGMFCAGMGVTALLGATCCCCFVRKERRKEVKYMINSSLVAQKLDRIEMRLAQQSNTPVQILTPAESRVNVIVSFHHGIILNSS